MVCGGLAMELEIFKGFQWWISAIEIPVISFMFFVINRNKQDADSKLDKLRNIAETKSVQLKDALSSYKLEVAKSYASINSLREVEKRLVEHLLRIEEKIEKNR